MPHVGVDAIPDVKGPIFDVTEYGARPDDGADDQESIQWILDTPMRKEIFDQDAPREALLKQWPTHDGSPWVEPGVSR